MSLWPPGSLGPRPGSDVTERKWRESLGCRRVFKGNTKLCTSDSALEPSCIWAEVAHLGLGLFNGTEETSATLGISWGRRLLDRAAQLFAEAGQFLVAVRGFI